MDRVRGAPILIVLVSLAFLAPVFGPTPAGAQEPAAEAGRTLLIKDPVGDVGPFGVGVEGNPAMTTYQHLDITELEVSDDSEHVILRLGFAGHDPTLTAPAQAVALNDYSCNIWWTYEDPPSGVEYSYRLNFYAADALRIPGSAPEESRTTIQRDYRGDEWDWDYLYDAPIEVRYDAETSSLVSLVPKTFAPVWPGGQVAHRGDTLVLTDASCASDLTLYAQMGDSVAIDQNARYALQASGPGSVVQVRYADQAGGQETPEGDDWDFPATAETIPLATIAPGTSTVLPVVLENLAKTRKLVQLSVDGAPAGWNLTLTPSVFLSAGEIRTVNLVITPPADAAIGDTHRINVIAQPVGESDHGAAGRLLKVMPRLDADHNTFHLHLEPHTAADPVNQAYYTALPQYQVAWSLLPEMDGFSNAPADVAPVTYWGGGTTLDPLVRPVRLDTERPVTVRLAFEGDATRDVAVQLYLTSEDTGTVFYLQETVPGDGVTELAVPLHGEGILKIPAGTVLYPYLRVGPADLAQTTGQAAIDPAQTSFSLPVVDDTRDVVVTDGRFLPSLSLAPDEDATTYINPGKQYAYDLVIANEGIETDDLTVRVNATNATDWGIEVLPGSTYRVSPGNSTPVSVVVTAPADAEEGAHPYFEVVAQSKHDKAVRTTIQLDAIVTTGVDIESKTYAEKENQIDPLADEVEEGPALGLLPMVLFGVAVAWARRVRPTRS